LRRSPHETGRSPRGLSHSRPRPEAKAQWRGIFYQKRNRIGKETKETTRKERDFREESIAGGGEEKTSEVLTAICFIKGGIIVSPDKLGI